LTGDEAIVWHLRMTEEDLGSVLVLVVEGRVSNATANELGQRLMRPDPSRFRALIVDLSNLEYINSVGLRVLEAAAARLHAAQCELVVCGLRPIVRTAFELAGSIAHLTIEPSREAAVRRLLGQDRTTRSAHG